MTEKAPLWEPFYPASFSTPCVTSVFRRKPLFRTGHRTRQIWLICEWDLGLAWLANLQKSCLSKHSTKTAKQGLVWEQGIVSLLSRQKPHTGPHRWDSEEIQLCLHLIFRIFSFLGHIPIVLFFVYAAQFLYRRLHSFDPLIMFYKTLLGDMETLSFPFAAIGCASSNCLKIGPNQCCYGVGIVSLPRLRKPHTTHTAGHAGRSCLTFVPDAFFLCTSRDIFSICCW